MPACGQEVGATHGVKGGGVWSRDVIRQYEAEAWNEACLLRHAGLGLSTSVPHDRTPSEGRSSDRRLQRGVHAHATGRERAYLRESHRGSGEEPECCVEAAQGRGRASTSQPSLQYLFCLGSSHRKLRFKKSRVHSVSGVSLRDQCADACTRG